MKSLDRTFTVLNVFLTGKTELSLSEIAQLSNLNKPTAWRICSAAVKYGYLIQQKKRGNYFLGTIYIAFNRVLTSDLYARRIMVPQLRELSEDIGELITVAYNSGLEDLYPESFGIQSSKLGVINKEHRLPLNATSLGKIFLAELSEKELENYFKNKRIIQHTPKTIVDLEQMKKHLVRIRKTGIAFDDEEWGEGIKSIAAGVRGQNNSIIAAICTEVPSVRMSVSRMNALALKIKECADNISQDLGFLPVADSKK